MLPIAKLEAYGIRGDLSAWMSNFLSNRFQRVVLNGQWVPVLSGVPQGSVWDLFYFVLYVNAIPDLVQVNVRMFADNTKVYSVIKSFHDNLMLQKDLDIA